MNPTGSDPLVSVVIPAYNAARSISRCLASVLRNGHENVEIIVVDDGSVDDTAVVVEQLVQRSGKVRLVKQANAGACSARNHGSRVARGEFVQFLDADDELIEGKLADAVARFCRNQGLVCVYSDMIVVADGVEGTVVAADHASVVRLAERGSGGFTCGLNTNMPVWRRDFLLASGASWNESLPCWQESVYYVELLTSMASSAQVEHAGRPFVRFHRDAVHAGVSSGYWSERYISGQARAVQILHARCKSLGMDGAALQRQYDEFCRRLLVRSIVGNQPVAWRETSQMVRRGNSRLHWRAFASVPFALSRMCYLAYRLSRPRRESAAADRQ